jgi:hypothetical protein
LQVRGSIETLVALTGSTLIGSGLFVFAFAFRLFVFAFVFVIVFDFVFVLIFVFVFALSFPIRLRLRLCLCFCLCLCLCLRGKTGLEHGLELYNRWPYDPSLQSNQHENVGAIVGVLSNLSAPSKFAAILECQCCACQGSVAFLFVALYPTLSLTLTPTFTFTLILTLIFVLFSDVLIPPSPPSLPFCPSCA